MVGTCFWVTSGGFAAPARPRLWDFGCAGPGLMQSAEVPCCVMLLCKQGTGGCRGFGTQTMLCHAPCVSPPAAWRGSVPRASHPLPWECCRDRHQSSFSGGAVGGRVVFRLQTVGTRVGLLLLCVAAAFTETWQSPGPSLQNVKLLMCLDSNESGFAGDSLFRQRCLCPCPPVPADITMVLCYLLRSCLVEGLPSLPRQWHLKGVLETSSGGKCIPPPVISLR